MYRVFRASKQSVLEVTGELKSWLRLRMTLTWILMDEGVEESRSCGLVASQRAIRKVWGTGRGPGGGYSTKDSVELILILLPETVPGREKLPAAFLVHLPYVRLLKERHMEETVAVISAWFSYLESCDSILIVSYWDSHQHQTSDNQPLNMFQINCKSTLEKWWTIWKMQVRTKGHCVLTLTDLLAHVSFIKLLINIHYCI